ncbi:MAG: hypothetical protein SGI77_10290 [Pirellulaceae bacterium]|nr:hypothetical protein [Pirellulaceae bacterium]
MSPCTAPFSFAAANLFFFAALVSLSIRNDKMAIKLFFGWGPRLGNSDRLAEPRTEEWIDAPELTPRHPMIRIRPLPGEIFGFARRRQGGDVFNQGDDPPDQRAAPDAAKDLSHALDIERGRTGYVQRVARVPALKQELGCPLGQIDKFEAFGLTAVPAHRVAPPLIADCFANLECKVADSHLVNKYRRQMGFGDHRGRRQRAVR